MIVDLIIISALKFFTYVAVHMQLLSKVVFAAFNLVAHSSGTSALHVSEKLK